MWVICSLKNVKQSHKLKKCQLERWPEMPLIFGRSGTQYVAMVTKLLSSNCGAHLVECYCKESLLLQRNISDTNWLRYIFHNIWSKFGWVYDVITWLICIFQKLKKTTFIYPRQEQPRSWTRGFEPATYGFQIRRSNHSAILLWVFQIHSANMRNTCTREIAGFPCS